MSRDHHLPAGCAGALVALVLFAGCSGAGTRGRVASTTASTAAALPCTAVLFVGARGSGEDVSASAAAGHMRMGRTVFALYSDLRRRLSGKRLSIAGYGLPYTAMRGGLGGGSAMLESLLERQASRCRAERVVVAGFSLGASVVGQALVKLTADPRANTALAGAVLFGDPRFNPHDTATVRGSFDPRFSGLFPPPREPFPAALAARVRDYCRRGDEACQAGSGIRGNQHQRYAPVETAAGAAFLADHLR